jgi:RNA polymerase sigma factor (sigma-70 family)
MAWARSSPFTSRREAAAARLGLLSANQSHDAIRRVFRQESARLVAGIVRLVRDVGLAEELAQDALVSALEQWPAAGIPDNPGAWLQAVARNRGINMLRRRALASRKHEQLAPLEAERERQDPHLEAKLDDDVGDDMLRLILIACDPVLPMEARIALTLRLLCGLTTDEIARAFLVPEPTIAQRIVRAKRHLGQARPAFEVPRGEPLAERLASVREVIYLVFNEGYAATVGDDLLRPHLCDDALRLGRMLVELVPGEAESHGLLGLMQLQQSRAGTRVDEAGDPVLLPDQDRARWDPRLIAQGLAELTRAESLSVVRGRHTVQAAIAACHARASSADATEWGRIASLYAELAAIAPSPVVELNRAMAVAMAHGPEAGLAIIDALADEPALRRYHLLPSARAHLLEKLGRTTEARREFERAASLTENTRLRSRLLDRAAACATEDSRSRT